LERASAAAELAERLGAAEVAGAAVTTAKAAVAKRSLRIMTLPETIKNRTRGLSNGCARDARAESA
jgi:hypothetical protein